MPDPHDRFFAFTFGQKEHAIGLLRAALPAELAVRLDWGSLERRSADFVDSRLRRRQSDLLFAIRTADTGEEVLVYALVEHQSRPHPLMAYRMLRYVVRVWEDDTRLHRRAASLPFVFPLVIYHGKAPWTAACALREIIHLPESLAGAAADHAPAFSFRLIDLRHDEAHRLAEELLTAFGRAALWAMKVAGEDQRVLAELGRMADVLNEVLAQPDGQAALGALLRYLFATHDRIEWRKLRRTVVEAVDPAAGEVVVTVYEQLIERGRKKGIRQGIEKGRAEGRAELLLTQIEAKFGPVDESVHARVKAADADELTAWGTRVLTAKTIAQVLGPSAAPRSARRTTRR